MAENKHYDEGFADGQKELAEQLLHTFDRKAGAHQQLTTWVPQVCQAVLDGQKPPQLKGVAPLAKGDEAALPPTGDPMADFIEETKKLPKKKFGKKKSRKDQDAKNAAKEGADAE